jgi:ABC-2 type transport system permease protein
MREQDRVTIRWCLGRECCSDVALRAGAIVAGKYLAALSVLAVSLAASFVYPLILAFLGEPSWSEAVSGFSGLLLLGGTLISAGTLVSSFAAKRWAAGALTLYALLLILLAQAVLPGMSEPIGGALLEATPSYHMDAFISGIIGLKDIVYFVSVSALLLFASVRVTTYRMRFR